MPKNSFFLFLFLFPFLLSNLMARYNLPARQFEIDLQTEPFSHFWISIQLNFHIQLKIKCNKHICRSTLQSIFNVTFWCLLNHVWNFRQIWHVHDRKPADALTSAINIIVWVLDIHRNGNTRSWFLRVKTTIRDISHRQLKTTRKSMTKNLNKNQNPNKLCILISFIGPQQQRPLHSNINNVDDILGHHPLVP